MPITFYFPEQWNAVLASTGPRWDWRKILKRR